MTREEALARGRAAWPTLVVDEETFFAALARSSIEAIAIEDLYLAQACVTGQRAAIEAFAQLCDPALAAALRQMGLSADSIDEISQDVRTKLLVGPTPRIATYSGRASLKSWTRTVATRAAVDRMRKHVPTSNDDELLDRVADPARTPELDHFHATYRGEFKNAFEEALATLDVRERNLLRHHFVDGLTTEEIGALYSVHKTTAFRWLEAARIALSKRVRAGFQQRLKVLPGELDSILTLLQSQIDLSLSRVL